MLHPEASVRRGSMSRIRWVALVALALLCWLSRMSLPHNSATVELDPTYTQVLGQALKLGLRFGREIVFTSGPLAYFTATPYDPQLYAAKFWLWAVLFGAFVSALLFWRLVRRGTWLDIGVGALTLIVLPVPNDGWLFAIGLVACDLGLSNTRRTNEVRGRGLRALNFALALLVLSILTLVKVSSLTFALACVAILALRATWSAGVLAGLRTLGSFALVQSLVWLCIGQRIVDLIPYFARSIELASGFDSAMSQPPTSLALVLCMLCLAAGLGLCAFFARSAVRSERRRAFDAPNAAAALVALALLLAYKAGFARANDHSMTFFNAAMIAPLFLLSDERVGESAAGWNIARLRCGIALLAAVCGLAAETTNTLSPGKIAALCANRIRSAALWISNHESIHAYLEQSRVRLAAANAIPRTKAIVGSRSISAFAEGDGVIFLNDLHGKPRPVFHAFSVLTQRTARENAAFLAGSAGPDFILWRQGSIDFRLPSSDDPLSMQVLLRDFQVRANEGEFLLLERARPRTTAQRSTIARAEIQWDERVELPLGEQPLVLEARIRPSLLGRVRAALYQTPEVFVDLEFSDGEHGSRRIAPFALEAGVVLRPCLPTKIEWIAYSRGQPTPSIVSLRFRTSVESAFAPSIEYEIVNAPDLSPRELDPTLDRELLLGSVGEIPLRLESPVAPELLCWGYEPVMLCVAAPARLCYAEEAGEARLSAEISVPPWIANAPGFAGVNALVYVRENGAERECARLELRSGVAGQAASSAILDVELHFDRAGELILEIEPVAGTDPELRRVGICNLRIER